jgi:hypothetical protein
MISTHRLVVEEIPQKTGAPEGTPVAYFYAVNLKALIDLIQPRN